MNRQAGKMLVSVGTFAALVVWGMAMPLLLHRVNGGEMTLLSLLAILLAMVALCVGAVRVLLGSKSRWPFITHLLLVVAAWVQSYHLPMLPILLGGLVAVAAWGGSYVRMPAAVADDPGAGES